MLPVSTASIFSTIVRSMISKPLGDSIRRLPLKAASALAPQLALKAAISRFVRVPRSRSHGKMHPLFERAEMTPVHTPLGKLMAWRIGEKNRPAILLNHGWGGLAQQFRSFVPALTGAGYQVVLFDHVGHGMSTGNQSALPAFCTGLAAVHRHYQLQGITFAGAISHSLGCAAMAYVARRSTLGAARLVQIAPPASVIRYSRFFARELGISERIRHAMQWRLEQRYGIAWQEFELPQSVAGLSVPALIIHDQDDRDVPMESGLAVARHWQGVRFKITRGLGHRRILHDPGVVQSAIDFINDEVVFSPPPAVSDNMPFPYPAPLY